MKFSYSENLEQYTCTDSGTLIDTDADLSELLRRHGMLDEAADIDVLTDFGCLPDPVPGEIICWVDDMPVYAEADPGEVESVDDFEESLDLSDFEEIE